MVTTDQKSAKYKKNEKNNKLILQKVSNHKARNKEMNK